MAGKLYNLNYKVGFLVSAPYVYYINIDQNKHLHITKIYME